MSQLVVKEVFKENETSKRDIEIKEILVRLINNNYFNKDDMETQNNMC